MGHGSIYTFSNDTGPDDANHAEHGMFIVYDPKQHEQGVSWRPPVDGHCADRAARTRPACSRRHARAIIGELSACM